MAIIAGSFLLPTISQSAGAATTLKPIVAGLICSCSGVEASTISQTEPSLEAWVAWVNAHGGVQGHHVKLIVKDDALNPATSVTDAKTLISVDHVVVLFDNSDLDIAWASYAQAHHVPVLGGVLTDPGYSNQYFVPPSTTYNYIANSAVLVLKKAGVTKVAQLYCAEVATCAQSVNAEGPALAKANIKVTYKAAISSAAPSYTAQCLAAKQSGANGITVAESSVQVTQVAEDCAAQAYEPIQTSGDGTVVSTWLKIPAMNNSVDFEEDYPWFLHNAVTKDMYAALNKYEPALLSSQNFSEISLITWTTGVELQEAAALGHMGATPTSASILNGLHKFHGQTLGGLAPPLTFQNGKTANNDCVFLMGIKNGKFVAPDGLKPFCGE